MKTKLLFSGLSVLLITGALGLAACQPAANQAANTPTPSSETSSELAPEPSEASVTMESFEAIQSGMSLAEVQEILGTEGTLANSMTSDFGAGEVTTESYNWTDDMKTITVTFQDGEVTNKLQIGLE